VVAVGVKVGNEGIAGVAVETTLKGVGVEVSTGGAVARAMIPTQ